MTKDECIEELAQMVYGEFPVLIAIDVPGRAGPLINPAPWDKAPNMVKDARREFANKLLSRMGTWTA